MFGVEFSASFGWHVVSYENPSKPFMVFGMVNLPDRATAEAVCRLLFQLDMVSSKLHALEGIVRRHLNGEQT